MFIDTSVLIDILLHQNGTIEFERIFEIIKDEPIYISVYQVGEYADWCHRNGIDPEEPLEKMKDITNIVKMTEDIFLEGSRIKHEQRMEGLKKFSLADGIIIASARSINDILLTKDNDFRRLECAIVIDGQ